MNRSKLKTYAPQARLDFIKAVTDRAAHYGLTEKKTEPITVEGDVAVIAGQAFPRSVAEKRRRLEKRIERQGFAVVMEEMAYTWFNRLMAIRYMELHGYLDHGYRVLSHPEGGDTPEIIEHAEHVSLPGIKKQQVIELKLEGDKEAELYRLLLLAQCHALHQAMPFLFEAIDDETELLLPDNLLHSDSLIRKLVSEIPEEDWQEVEIIGWLYQFYISDKKDEVIGKVVKSEDIPAATQLFTPNWIVKYMVQNSLGRQWMATYPASPLREQMEYYIEPAEQTPEVQSQLAEITPESLDPEKLTLMDPACGSGHILVEAYDLFKAIYQERGYRRREIPSLILRNNLFGLEIDERAAQLASFAVLMKARADDPRIFEGDQGPWMNIRCIRSTDGLDAGDIYYALTSEDVGDEPPSEEFEFMEEIKRPLFAQGKEKQDEGQGESFSFTVDDIRQLLSLFKDGAAETFGSLIRISPSLGEKLSAIAERADYVAKSAERYDIQVIAEQFAHVAEQALLLSHQYDAVCANPPYMGGSYFPLRLKHFVNEAYSEGKADLYSCFIQRNSYFAVENGFVGMITIPNWMFLTSFRHLRTLFIRELTIDTLIHNGRGVFGSDFGSCSFVYRNCNISLYSGTFRRLFEKQGSVATNEELGKLFYQCASYQASMADFSKIPEAPIAYWISQRTISTFTDLGDVSEHFFSDGVTKTGNNEMYLRFHWEPSAEDVANIERYRFCTKGGEARKYYGNYFWVVDWRKEVRDHYRRDRVARITPEYLWDFQGITWSDVTIALPTFRYFPAGFIAETKGPVIFPKVSPDQIFGLLGLLNSKYAIYIMSLLNPTVSTKIVDIFRIPFQEEVIDAAIAPTRELVALAETDWNYSETSWEFQRLAIVNCGENTLERAHEAVEAQCTTRIIRMKQLEEENNRLFIEAYGLQEELSPDVPEDQITLYRPDRGEDIKRLISYAIGCMMGRYNLDEPGLIYAHSGNEGFDPSRYKTFLADADGIVPITDTPWFEDDAACRFETFIATAWPAEHLQENLTFIAESLGPKKGESPSDTIRRYFSQGFFKHHLQMYKKRPIYWLFSSGKQKAFECLVYLHRYNPGTLSRMRTEYVIPLQGKIAARIEQLGDDIKAATSTTHSRRLQKELDRLVKQQAELRTFEEKLRHYADRRIALDLDDGVKANYGLFGDLLAEVKAVHGKKV